MKPDQVDRIRGDYYEIIKRRPWFRNEENSENQDSIIQVIRNIEIFEILNRPEIFLGSAVPLTIPLVIRRHHISLNLLALGGADF